MGSPGWQFRAGLEGNTTPLRCGKSAAPRLHFSQSCSLPGQTDCRTQLSHARMLETNREGGASSIVSAANICGEVLMMRRMWIFAGCVLFLSTFAMAQHRGGGMGGGTVGAAPVVVAAPHVAGVAPRVAARVSPATRVATAPVGVHHGTHVNAMTAHGNFRSGPANLPLFPTSFGNVPGLGFDYPHMAAVN